MLAQETQAEMSSCPGLWIVSVKLQSLEHILIRTAGNIAEIIDPTFRLLQSSYQQLTQISHHREKPECSHILILLISHAPSTCIPLGLHESGVLGSLIMKLFKTSHILSSLPLDTPALNVNLEVSTDFQ